jgi:hypothetical protein
MRNLGRVRIALLVGVRAFHEGVVKRDRTIRENQQAHGVLYKDPAHVEDKKSCIAGLREAVKSIYRCALDGLHYRAPNSAKQTEAAMLEFVTERLANYRQIMRGNWL